MDTGSNYFAAQRMLNVYMGVPSNHQNHRQPRRSNQVALLNQ